MNSRIDIGTIRREQIVSVVRTIVAREGLEAVTIARIASEAKISRGVVTYHFASKEEIIHAAVRAAMHDANRAADAIAVEGSATGLAALAERVAGLAGTTDWWHMFVALHGLAEQSEFFRSELQWANQHYREALAGIVGGEARATVLLALLQGLALQRMADEELPMTEITREIAALLERWDI